MQLIARSIAVVVLALAGGWAAAADVGRVVLAAGDATALRAGQSVRLSLGAPVQEKDVLRTGVASNLQVRFEDESYVSLRESSELRVDEFRKASGADSVERAVFSLVKGGLRAVTGLIGRINHDDYKLVTPTASIGIRGTDYAATLCQGDCRNPDGSAARDGLYGRVIGQSQGTNQIHVSNEADRRTLGVNANFFVGGNRSPVETLLASPAFVLSKLESRSRGGSKGAAGGNGNEKATSGGASEESRPSNDPAPVLQLPFVITQSLGPDGVPQVLGEEHKEKTGMIGQIAYSNLSPPAPGTTWTLSPDMTTYSGSNPVAFTTFSALSGNLAGGSIVETGSAPLADGGTISWGRWIGATQVNDQVQGLISPSTGLFFVVGQEATLPTSGTFTYTFAGGPNPTNINGVSGTFTGGAFSVTFGSTSGSLSVASPLTLSVGGVGYTLGTCSSGCTFTNNSGVSGNMQITGTCSGGACLASSPATASGAGVFVGPQAAGFGVAGSIFSPAPTVAFSAGFTR